jgi:carboxylesterase type B
MAVRNNVVAVTINYRLGSLGGLYTGADTILGNFQLRDQRLAMQWVQQNIASFGGDPTRVTIYGESAGAYSVMTHLVSPRSFGLFKSVIAESAPFGIEAESPKSGQELATLYLAKLGCPPLTNASHVACLRSQSVGALVAADNVALVKRGVAMPMEWTPVVDNDQLPYQILEGILMKKVAPGTSVIIGTNTNEFDLFVDTQYPNPMNYSSLITELTTFFNASIAATLITMYNPSPSSPDLRETFSAIQTDYFMGCPSRYAVRNLNISYLYQYRHVNSFNWLLSLFGAMPSQCVAKACHSAELYLLFNPFYVLWNIIRPTAGEESLSSQMETYWTNLATSGNPNFPVRPNVTWNQGAQASMLYLDDPISMGPNFDSAQCDFFDSIGYNRR